MEPISTDSTRRSVEVHTLTWHYLSNLVKTMALVCAVELHIPDAIHKHGGQPVTVSQLALELGIPQSKTDCLRRLMRLLSLSNFFDVQNSINDQDGEDAYLLTTRSSLLLWDTNSFSLAPIVSGFHQPCFLSSWQSLGAWFRSSDSPSPFRFANGGASLWDAASQSPELNASFNDAMAKDSQLFMSAAVQEHGDVFRELKSLVDVGGGNGHAALALAKAFPHLKCTVLDLPHVVADVPKGSTELVEYIGGDMFDHIPPADAVLLKTVLHDWGDDHCLKILRNCKEAIPPKKEGGKVIIIDIVMSKDVSQEMKEIHNCFDLGLMMLNEGGKERSEDEWKKLLYEAGFTGYKTTHGLGMRSIVEAYY